MRTLTNGIPVDFHNFSEQKVFAVQLLRERKGGIATGEFIMVFIISILFISKEINYSGFYNSSFKGLQKHETRNNW